MPCLIAETELISDAKMYLFVEKDMRGRIYYVSKRYGNNKYLNSCDPKREEKPIL